MKNHARHLLQIAVLVLLGLQASSAMAGDLLPPPPPPPPIYAPAPQVYAPPPPFAYQPLPLRGRQYLWSGGYAGGFVGAQCADIVATKTAVDKGGTSTSSATFDGCTAQGGLIGGYNVQYDEIVYGVETDYAMGGNMLTRSKDGANVGTDFMMTLRGRMGYAFNSTMAYVTGGAAVAQGSVIDDTNWHLGWVAGVGVEQKVSDNLALRAEFLHADFNSRPYSSGTCCEGDVAFDNVNMARLGLTWSFGQMIAPSPPTPIYPVQVGG